MRVLTRYYKPREVALLVVAFLFGSFCRWFIDRSFMNDHVRSIRAKTEIAIQPVTVEQKTITKPKRNILLTANVLRTSTDRCSEKCEATRNSLVAGTECAARTMGKEWEAMAITDLDEFEKRYGFDKQDKQKPEPHEWPFPHYIKIHVLERLMFANSGIDTIDEKNAVSGGDTSSNPDNFSPPEKHDEQMDAFDNDQISHGANDIDWIAWVDADVRIVNASYPVGKFLDERAQFERVPFYGREDDRKNNLSTYGDTTKNDVSIVVNSQYANNIINNLFFLKNNPWGKRFLRAWKHFTLHGENKHKWWKTCGFYDQCPFGVAMVQVAQDYFWSQRQRNEWTDDDHEEEKMSNLLQSRQFNATLEEMAFRSGGKIQYTLLGDELDRLMSLQSNNWTKTNAPLQIGPILLLPTWEGRVRLPSSESSIHHPNDKINSHDSGTGKYPDDFIPTSMTYEPTNLFQDRHTDTPWPFAIHAKFSELFCHEHAKYFFDFEAMHEAIHRDRCTSSEILAMRNDDVLCWARWRKTVRKTD